jgi:prefoldin subunit 5
MARVGVYDQIKTAFQDLIAPELQALRGEIRVIDQRIISLDQKIDGVDVHLGAKIDSLRGELLSEIRRLDTRIDSVDRELRTAIDIRERLAALEARRSP